MASLLILAFLITISKASPARQEKRDVNKCSPENFGFVGQQIRRLEDIFTISANLGMDIPWEDLENFSFRNTVLELFDNNTSQNAINFFIAMWSRDLYDSIAKNTGGPYVEMSPIDKKYKKIANQMVFKEVAKCSRKALKGFDMANMEIHRCISKPQMVQEMIEMISMNVFMMQGMAEAMIDWESINLMLDCYEEYLSNSDHDILKALKEINVDPKICIQHARRLFSSLQTLVRSSDLHMGSSIIAEAGIKMIEKMHIDELWTTVYYVVLHLRGHCLQTDFNSVATEVIKICDTMCKGLWKLTTGRWPELETYLQKLMAVLQTDTFWMRLDKLYLTFIMEAKSLYIENKDMMMAMVSQQLMPMCTMVVDTIEKASNEIEPSFMELSKYMSMIPSHMIKEVLEMIPYQIESFVLMLPSSNMVCNSTAMMPMEDEVMEMEDDLMPMEDYLMIMEDNIPRMQQMESFLMGVNQTLCDLFFSDWPEGMIMPKGVDSVKKLLKECLWKINAALVRPYCEDHSFELSHYNYYSDMAIPEYSVMAFLDYSDRAYPEYEPESEPKSEHGYEY